MSTPVQEKTKHDHVLSKSQCLWLDRGMMLGGLLRRAITLELAAWVRRKAGELQRPPQAATLLGGPKCAGAESGKLPPQEQAPD